MVPSTSSKVSAAEAWLTDTHSHVGKPETYSMSVANGNSMSQYSTGYPGYQGGPLPSMAQRRAPHLSHIRSHSIDTAEIWDQQQQRNPSLRQLAHTGHPLGQFTSQQNGAGGTWSPPPHSQHPQPGFDPFDAAWAARKVTANNPFQAGQTDTVTKSFEVNL